MKKQSYGNIYLGRGKTNWVYKILNLPLQCFFKAQANHFFQKLNGNYMKYLHLPGWKKIKVLLSSLRLP